MGMDELRRLGELTETGIAEFLSQTLVEEPAITAVLRAIPAQGWEVFHVRASVGLSDQEKELYSGVLGRPLVMSSSGNAQVDTYQVLQQKRRLLREENQRRQGR
jgi:hypothetical protein